MRVFALVEYGGEETNFMSNIAIDEMEKITVKFHRRRLTEDQDLELVTLLDMAIFTMKS